jgi:hypothetical protein
MTEDELVQRVRERSQNPQLTTSAAGWSCDYAKIAESFPPAEIGAVREAENRFGFPLPKLLVRLWAEVANGGIGPDCGIYGVENGMTDDTLDLPLPDLYLVYRDDQAWIDHVGKGSAATTFPICDWGCCTFSAIDCSAPGGKMILYLDGVERIDQGVSFARWIDDWVNGINVGTREYRPWLRPRRADDPGPERDVARGPILQFLRRLAEILQDLAIGHHLQRSLLRG